MQYPQKSNMAHVRTTVHIEAATHTRIFAYHKFGHYPSIGMQTGRVRFRTYRFQFDSGCKDRFRFQLGTYYVFPILISGIATRFRFQFQIQLRLGSEFKEETTFFIGSLYLKHETLKEKNR